MSNNLTSLLVVLVIIVGLIMSVSISYLPQVLCANQLNPTKYCLAQVGNQEKQNSYGFSLRLGKDKDD